MKAVIMFISLICASFYAYGQKPPAYGKAAAGIDIGKIIRHRTIDIEISYAFTRHWSMKGSSSFLLHMKTRQKSEEEIMHESLLGEVKETESGLSQGRHMACLCYWTEEAFKKGFISIGCRYEEHERPECVIGFGYIMPIWKGLAMSLSIEGRGSMDIGLKYIF